MLLSVYGTGCPEEYGCTNPLAENFDPIAVWDDGSCIVPISPCQDEAALIYEDETYGLLVLGEACWFDRNLRTGNFANGETIGEISGSFDWYQAGADGEAAYSEVTSDAELSAAFGYYYNGYAVLDDRGLCPSGWHAATDEDWQALESLVGMESADLFATGARGTDQGEQLKATAEDDPGWNGTNTVELTILPTGKRFNFGSISGVFNSALHWSPAGGTTLMSREFTTDSPQITRNTTSSAFGATVRCVKNPE
jgi:uncharacterized protein (TIGR02145 family)